MTLQDEYAKMMLFGNMIKKWHREFINTFKDIL